MSLPMQSSAVVTTDTVCSSEASWRGSKRTSGERCEGSPSDLMAVRARWSESCNFLFLRASFASAMDSRDLITKTRELRVTPLPPPPPLVAAVAVVEFESVRVRSGTPAPGCGLLFSSMAKGERCGDETSVFAGVGSEGSTFIDGVGAEPPLSPRSGAEGGVVIMFGGLPPLLADCVSSRTSPPASSCAFPRSTTS